MAHTLGNLVHKNQSYPMSDQIYENLLVNRFMLSLTILILESVTNLTSFLECSTQEKYS